MVTHAKQRSIEADALRELAAFPLVEALYGRRSRRFALGDEIPDGPLAYRSTREPVSLTELERMLVLTAMAGTTGWHYAITRHSIAAPTLVLAGGSDLTARPRLCRAVADLIPDARFEILEGEAYQPFQEVPEEWNARVDGFWREVEWREREASSSAADPSGPSRGR
jgi:pimeloyl-ACP methyl ester carboxylesterase